MYFAQTFFSDQDVAKEAVQTIFIRIWEKRERLDSSKNFRTYLFQAAKFYMYNHVRDRKRSCRLEEAPGEAFLKQNTIEDEMIYQDLESTTYSSIEKLPKIQQQVFRLNKLEGKTTAEIAEKLNLSKRTIDHHIYLATKKVKSELLHYISFYIPVSMIQCWIWRQLL